MKSATIYLEGQCNLSCKHCLVGKDHVEPRQSLATSDVRAVLTSLRNADVRQITLLGGEVTIYRRDLPELLDCCDALGLRVSLNTNGMALSRLVELLNFECLQNITISLDGASARSHDFLRGDGNFDRVVRSIRELRRHIRKPRTLDITCALNDKNFDEASGIIELANELEVDKLNIQELRIAGVAHDNKHELATDLRLKFYAAIQLLIHWRIRGKTELSFHLPPAFGYYMQRRFGLFGEQANFNACGGTGVYGYIDLLGNHLPCPAMSQEESPITGLSVRSNRLSAIRNDVRDIWNSSVFKGFNLSVANRHRNQKMEPCRICRFSERCSPCTASVIGEKVSGTVDLCLAVQRYGDEYVTGISEDVFQTAGAEVT